WLVPAAYRQQGSRDVPHHVVEEPVRRDIQYDAVATAAHSNRVNFPDRMAGLATGGPKSGKIMFSLQHLGCLMHVCNIQRFAMPAQVIRFKSRPDPPVQYTILIGPGKG